MWGASGETLKGGYQFGVGLGLHFGSYGYHVRPTNLKNVLNLSRCWMGRPGLIGPAPKGFTRTLLETTNKRHTHFFAVQLTVYSSHSSHSCFIVMPSSCDLAISVFIVSPLGTPVCSQTRTSLQVVAEEKKE